MLAQALDLVLPVECGGCRVPGTRWCAGCAAAWSVRADAPHVVAPRVDPGVPVLALGRYAGPRREAIVALKERGRADLVAPLARALAEGIHRLMTWAVVGPGLVGPGLVGPGFVGPGFVGRGLTLVPAPTRAWVARRRGGDPVARIAAAATLGHPHLRVVRAVRTRGLVRDSVGLSTTDRERNISGRVRLVTRPAGEVLLVDDVLTTGATAREAVRTLHAAGVDVGAVLVLAYA